MKQVNNISPRFFTSVMKHVIFIVLMLLITPLLAHALPGDLDGSARVDGYDLIFFGLANGSKSGDANWNADADLNGDGTVDSSDLAILSYHFGNQGLSFGLWVGDRTSGDQRIAKVSSRGNVLKRVGSFNNPASISSNVTDGTVWVADSTNDQVKKLAPFDGATLMTINGMDPYSVSVNSKDGSVWVADYTNNRVIKLLPTITDGYTIGTDTGSHIVIKGFNKPRSISVNPETGVIWVADTSNSRIVRLASDVADGYDISTGSGSHVIKTGFNSPYAVSVNVSDGSVWVADTFNHQVVKLSSTGTTEIYRIGGFNQPYTLDVNYIDGSVWVSDYNNNQIVRISFDGAIMMRASGFNRPISLSVNPLDGTCWVGDYNNNQIVKLAPNGTELLRIGGFPTPGAISVTPDVISALTLPIASTVLSSNNVEPAETITFTGTGSDPDGTIILYEWDFDGNGTFDYQSTATGITTHSYANTGIYNPVFRVTDNSGLTATDYSKIIRIGSLKATAGANKTSGVTPLVVTFTASFVDPINGFVDTYQWDFDGDNVFDYYSESTGNTSHTYTKAGTYNATLKITDGPHAALDTITITVTPSSPVASASASPASGAAPLSVNLNGSGYDPDGTVLLYQWDLNGDGTFDWFSGTAGNASHTYTTPGIYKAKFKITDNDGLTDEKEVTIDVGKVPPVAKANASPVSGHPTLTVSFNATGSIDPDGTITKYEWDFDGDGTYDWNSASTGTTTNAYNTPGTYNAVLQLTDNDGNTGTATVAINVIPLTQPIATADATPKTGVIPLTVNFTGTAVDDGTISQYHWNFGEEYVWVADYAHDQVVKVKPDGSGEEIRKSGFNNPYSVSINPINTSVWIADYYNSQVVQLSVNGTEMARVNGFYYPTSVSVNTSDGTVWVADYNHDQVVKLKADGSGELARVGGFNNPISVSVNSSDGSVWVADYYNNQVVKLDASGAELARASGFSNPISVSVNPADGTVWVADASHNQVVKLKADGSSELARVSGFYYPYSVSVNSTDGTVWVADHYNDKVVKLKADGSGELARVGGFYRPTSVAVNPNTGMVWVADYYHSQVVKLDSSGTELARLGGFSYPLAVAVADSGSGNYYSSASTGTTSHTYNLPGTYNATLTVTDNDGNKARAGVQISIKSAPNVSAVADVSSGPAPLKVSLSGIVTDPDGSPAVKYEWDFDGDGSYDWTSTGLSNTTYTYAAAGAYQAKLRVTDSDGNTGTGTVTITVNKAAPVAIAAAAPLKGNATVTINLAGSGTDSDGTITKYEWDFDGDGTYDWNSGSTGVTTHDYDTAGTYNAVLRVTDNDGLTATSSVQIQINPSGTPFAFLYATPVQGKNPLDVMFCGHGSDSDGTIATYEWDLDGDGTYETSSSQATTAFGDNMEQGESDWEASSWSRIYTDSYSKAYSWTDSPGGDYSDNTDSSLSTITIDLTAATDPKLIFWHHYAFKNGDSGRVEISGDGGTNWSLIGSFTNGTVSSWTKQQYSLSAYKGNATVKVRFRVLTDASDTADGWYIDDVWVGDCISYNYANQGIYPVKLRVTDDSGKQDIASQSIKVFSNLNTSYTWVADYYNGRVVKMSNDGNILATIGGFYYLRSVQVDKSNGDVWVADTGNNRVVKLSANIQRGYSLSGTNTADSSLNINGGVLSGDAVFVAGNLNNGISLDGNGDFVQISDSQDLRMDSWTMEAWVKPTSTASGNKVIVGKVSQGKDFAIVQNGDKLGVLVYQGGRQYVLSSTAVTADTWYHVAGVYDKPNGKVKLYIDGAFVTEGSFTSDTSNTDPMRIGSAYCCGEYFSGVIDDVRIWNVARSAAEIASSRNSELAGSETGLAAYWKLNGAVTSHQVTTGFNNPYFIDVDNTDHSAWVTDYYNSKVVKLNQDGTVAASLTGFSYPQRVSVYQADQSVWVSDFYHNQIVKLDKNGTELLRIGGFYNPVGISVDQSDGSVWVADYNKHQIAKLSAAGTQLFRAGGFYYPITVVVNQNDHSAWVTDHYHHQVVKLSPNGAELVRANGFYYPHDLDVNQMDGTVWISDHSHSQMVKLAPGGTELLRIGGFNGPIGVSIDTGINNMPQPPVASATVNPADGNAPLTVTFTGSATDNGSIVRYEWDFDGNGTFDYDSSSSGSTVYTYTTPGAYSPVFRVTDNDGLMGYDTSHTVNVGPFSVYPSASPLTGNAPLSVNFSGVVKGIASGRSIAKYEWDFNSDGIFDWSSASGPTVTYKYNTGGAYLATLRVTDNLGYQAFGNVAITVNKVSPTAWAGSNPSSGSVPLNVNLDGSASDADGSIVLYEWDYDGDGIYDWWSDSTADTLFTYRTVGTYTATFRVTDNDGFKTTATTTIIVNDRQDPPIANASADKVEGNASLTVNFTGTANDPDDGTINLYEWDFDGDGTYDWSSTTTGSTSYTYTAPGNYYTSFRVTDLDNLTDTAALLITVKSAGTPNAVANANPESGDAPLTVDFNANGSSDPDGTLVKYEWVFGDEIVWVADYNNNQVVRLEGGQESKRLSGYNRPYRLAIDQGNGVVWIADYEGDRVVKLKADGSGALASISGFDNPWGIAVDQTDGSAWVTVWNQSQVVKLKADGSGELARLSGFYHPTGVTVDPARGTVWVADYDNNQVVRLLSDGTEISRMYGFNRPIWVSIDPADGAAWIADRYNNRVVKLDADTPNGYTASGSSNKTTANETSALRPGYVYGDTVSAAGNLNNGLSFDGNGDYITIGNSPVYKSDSWTIEGWIKPAVWSSDRVIAGKVSQCKDFAIGLSGDKIAVWTATPSECYRHYVKSTASVVAGQWYHVAGVYDSVTQNLKLYVDGVLAGEATFPSDTSNTNPVQIGSNNSPGEYFNGVIDDVRIWNTARSATEIANNKDAELTGSESGLTGYWKLEASQDVTHHKALAGFSETLCTGVDPIDGSVWVCNYQGQQMVKVNKDCTARITSVGGFSNPHEASVNPYDGTVWVPDHSHGQIVKISSDGTELKRIGGFNGPTSAGIYNSPSNVFSSSADGNATHTFKKVSEYLATLKVTDNDGNSDRDTVMIKAGIYPESLPKAYPTTGSAPLTVRFSSDGKSPQSTITAYYWDFDGNGSTDNGNFWDYSLSKTYTYTYHSPGVYQASQTVVDSRGLSDKKYITITVLPPQGIPVAKAMASPSEGNAPLTVNLTGAGKDLDGFIKKYEWDYTNDGTFEYSSNTSPDTSYVYPAQGVYTAVFRVTDDDNNTATDSARIEISPVGSPVATAVATPTTGFVTLKVSFTGSAVDNGTIVKYEWDFDGDGTYDWSSPTSAATFFNYSASGVYNATLRVTDNDGMTDTSVVRISVAPKISVSLSDDLFDPSSSQVVVINSVLTGDATITIKINDKIGSLVRTLVSSVPRTAGFYSDTWDGKNTGGQVVPSGVYYYVIEYSAGGITYVHDITNSVSKDNYAPSVTYPSNFDPLSSVTNFFRYTLPQKSDVTINMSHWNWGGYWGAGPRVKTLLLRKPQKAGSYVMVWDGTDDAGNLVEPGEYLITVWGWRLADNAIIVATEPIISDLLVTPTYLNPNAQPYDDLNEATFKYTLSKTATVRAYIYDSENYLIKTITMTDVPAGSGRTITWDGKNTGGKFVAPGTYRLRLVATDANGTESLPANALLVIFY